MMFFECSARCTYFSFCIFSCSDQHYGNFFPCAYISLPCKLSIHLPYPSDLIFRTFAFYFYHPALYAVAGTLFYIDLTLNNAFNDEFIACSMSSAYKRLFILISGGHVACDLVCFYCKYNNIIYYLSISHCLFYDILHTLFHLSFSLC